jgi:site-specific DNA-methyltransferase (adenine-specific)
MRKEVIGNCTLYLGKMEDTIGDIEKVDHILTDPPYLYIKTHAFDKEFDEQLFFENAKRLLSDDGFIVLFGRGKSFYRWNNHLANMGFLFKEEIIWNKRCSTSPCHVLARVHETISIHSRRGKIHRSKVPYIEQKQYDIESIVHDIMRIKSAIKNDAGLHKVLAFLQGENLYTQQKKDRFAVSQQPGVKAPDRAAATLNSIKNGMVEKSIIKCNHAKKHCEHPAEKPVRLAERLLALISSPFDTVYDPFMGSGSFGVACINMGRKYIGSEIMPEYFDIACRRIEEAYKQPQLEVADG